MATFKYDGSYISNDWTEHPNGNGYQGNIEGGRPDLQGASARVDTGTQAVYADSGAGARYGWHTP